MDLGPQNVIDQISNLEKNLIDTRKQLFELRQQVKPAPVEDYELTTVSGEQIKLSQMFEGKKDLLIVHNMGSFCPYCTLWADGFNGVAAYFLERTSFALVSSDDHDKLRAFAQKRGWKFPVVSSKGSRFKTDLGFEHEGDNNWEKFTPGASSFSMAETGEIYLHSHTYFGPGDAYSGIWWLFDMLKGGVGDWQPNFNEMK